MDYNTLVKQLADKELTYILEHGFAHAGFNGPYYNQDTPVRNSAHWIVTYSYLYEKTGKQEYYDAAKILSEYLLRKENYGTSGSIRCRTDARYDHTNGLIGQAWVIEGLVESARLFKDLSYYEKAVQLFKIQEYNSNNNLWEVTDCNGEKDYDLTFNHQLWFAASGAMILEFETENKINKSVFIDNQIQDFLSAAEKKYFKVKKDGCIVHVVDYQKSPDEVEHSKKLQNARKMASITENPVKVIKKKITDKLSKFSLTEGLEEGYHIFDLYGFALLKKLYGNHSIYKSDNFKAAVHYALDTNQLLKLRNSCGGEKFNKFAFGYNSPAFEYPFVAYMFNGTINQFLVDKLFQFQLDATYKEDRLSQNCVDPNTLEARIYELVRYLQLNELHFTRRKKQKVCFLTNNIAEMGGRQRVNALLASEMSKTDDLDVSIVFTSNYKTAMKRFYYLNNNVRVLWSQKLSPSKRDSLYKIARYINKKIIRFRNTSFLQFVYFPPYEVRNYNQFFSDNKFDVVVGVGTRAGAMLSLLNDKSKKVVWLHNSYDVYFLKKDYFQWHQDGLYKKLLSKPDAMVVLTDGDINRYKRYIECDPIRIYNPLTLVCKDEAKLENNELVFVGRLDYDIKGLDLLADIFSIVKMKISEARLTIVGDGNGRKRLEETLAKLNLQHSVNFVGQRDNVMQYYQQGSVVLLTSRKEGFGLVTTETMECGLPVVSFKTEGPSEIINDGRNGFLIDNYDVNAFAEKVILICKNKELRSVMGRKAKERAKDFSIDKIVNEWRELFVRI